MFKKIFSLFESLKLDLNGTWYGTYKFGKQYPLAVQDKVVHWVTEIKQSGERNFIGSIEEDEIGIPEKSTIEGTINGIRLIFQKTYQNSYSVDESGKTIVGEGPYYVTYSGIYDTTLKRFSGDWKIVAEYQFKDGSTREHTSTGTWQMGRTKGYFGLGESAP